MFGLQTPAGGPRSPFYELANSQQVKIFQHRPTASCLVAGKAHFGTVSCLRGNTSKPSSG